MLAERAREPRWGGTRARPRKGGEGAQSLSVSTGALGTQRPASVLLRPARPDRVTRMAGRAGRFHGHPHYLRLSMHRWPKEPTVVPARTVAGGTRNLSGRTTGWVLPGCQSQGRAVNIPSAAAAARAQGPGPGSPTGRGNSWQDPQRVAPRFPASIFRRGIFLPLFLQACHFQPGWARHLFLLCHLCILSCPEYTPEDAKGNVARSPTYNGAFGNYSFLSRII